MKGKFHRMNCDGKKTLVKRSLVYSACLANTMLAGGLAMEGTMASPEIVSRSSPGIFHLQ